MTKIIIIAIIIAISAALASISYNASSEVAFAQLQVQNGTGVNLSASHGIGQTNDNATTTTTTEKQLPLKVIFKNVDNSVVQITRSLPQNGLYPNTNPLDQNLTVLGSGFVYNKQGQIITNNHVVSGAKFVEVTFIDGNIYKAEVIGSDVYSDIAVLQMLGNYSGQKLQPLYIGNSSKLEVGDQVIAVGNPFGLSNTMTTGIVSHTGRFFSIPELGISIPNAIQTDADINPGNSGGPLLNMQGQVVGVNSGGLIGANGGSVGANFAIPSTTILRMAPILVEKGNYTHAWLGILGTTLTSDLAKSLENLDANVKGIFVISIVKDGPADKAGMRGSNIDQYSQLHGGDVILAVDHKPVKKMEEFISYLEENKGPGDKIMVSVYRSGQVVDIETIAGERPQPQLQGQPPYGP